MLARAADITPGCKSLAGRAMRRREGGGLWAAATLMWACGDLTGLFLPVGPPAGLRARLR